MDFVPHFQREVAAFEAAVRRAAGTGGVPLVPACPGWSVADLVMHLGAVHRSVLHIVRDGFAGIPDPAVDPGFLAAPADTAGWPMPDTAPNFGPLPASLLDWFAAGAAELAQVFGQADPARSAWTFSVEQTVGFWMRIQSIEAAVHRWDAESAFGAPGPIDAELAADAVSHTFEVLVPTRRSWQSAVAGAGERFGFRRTDGAQAWSLCFEGDQVQVGAGEAATDVEVAGTAAELMLFLWRRIPAERVQVSGDREVLDRYFTLVPPL